MQRATKEADLIRNIRSARERGRIRSIGTSSLVEPSGGDGLVSIYRRWCNLKPKQLALKQET